MEFEDRSWVSIDLFFLVGVDEESKNGSIGSESGLDHMRDEGLVCRLVSPEQILATVF